MRQTTSRQTATTRAVRQYMTSRGLSHAEMSDRLGMNLNTFRGRLSLRSRWTPDELDLLVLLGVEVPALGMPEAVGA